MDFDEAICDEEVSNTKQDGEYNVTITPKDRKSNEWARQGVTTFNNVIC